MKKNVIIIFVSIIVVILVLSSLVVFASNGKQELTLEEKATQEIKYIDNYLVSMLGDFNGLHIGSFLKEDNSSEWQFDSLQASQKSNSNTQSSNSENNSEGNSEKSSKNEEESQSKDHLINNKPNSKDAQNGVLANQGKYNTQWDTIQTQIENLYQSWNTISIDLNTLNVDGKSILAFNDYLNSSTQSIKKKDKKAAMEEIAKLYQLLPKYSENYKPNSKETNVLEIKNAVVTAYVYVSNEDWASAKKQLSGAITQFTNLLNSVGQNFQNQTLVNQCYILVNELNKAIGLQDREIFFIQYQNLMGKMDII
ncbi:MAG: hypothetical protein HFJ32_00410 [Clostridia bacterium]|nr:hypothetical protein [Clostridia bacterium]